MNCKASKYFKTPRNIQFTNDIRGHLKQCLTSETGELTNFPGRERCERESKMYLATMNVRIYCDCRMQFNENNSDPEK